jgi:hypothetical protein
MPTGPSSRRWCDAASFLPRWLTRRGHRLVINTAGGICTALVVVLFAVVKFTEGAWLIVILFPVREYRTEAAIAALREPAPPGAARRAPRLART